MPKNNQALKTKKKTKEKIVMISGGFDPIHIGHIRYMQEAKKLGSKLVVVINNDNWLYSKKGYFFMPEEERKEIIEALGCVDEVIISGHKKNMKGPKAMSVVKEIKRIKPDIFAKGGDRDQKDANKIASSLNPEQELCRSLGIEVVFNVGRGGKIRSSSELVKQAQKNKK